MLLLQQYAQQLQQRQQQHQQPGTPSSSGGTSTEPPLSPFFGSGSQQQSFKPGSKERAERGGGNRGIVESHRKTEMCRWVTSSWVVGLYPLHGVGRGVHPYGFD